jgi:hypothetical protein
MPARKKWELDMFDGSNSILCEVDEHVTGPRRVAHRTIGKSCQRRAEKNVPFMGLFVPRHRVSDVSDLECVLRDN